MYKCYLEPENVNVTTRFSSFSVERRLQEGRKVTSQSSLSLAVTRVDPKTTRLGVHSVTRPTRRLGMRLLVGKK